MEREIKRMGIVEPITEGINVYRERKRPRGKVKESKRED